MELGLELLPVLDVTVGVDAYSKGVDTRYRDLVDAERGEIPVNLKLKVVPVVAGVRLFPLGKLRSVLPYVAAGGGLYVVDARLQGSLVDLETLDITSGERSERFWAPGGFLGGGVEVLLSEGVDPGQGWFLGVGFRRSWVRLGPVSESGAARSRFDGWDGSVAVAVRF